MKTNLIFRKQIVENNTTKIVHKILPVELPDTELTGWQLVGHTDSIEVFDDTIITKPDKINTSSAVTDVLKFHSDVPGTAKLVRRAGTISIVYRKGKTTYNESAPNSICIAENIKESFFDACRQTHGASTTTFKFSTQDSPYSWWNKFIDEEYQRQKDRYMKKLTTMRKVK